MSVAPTARDGSHCPTYLCSKREHAARDGHANQFPGKLVDAAVGHCDRTDDTMTLAVHFEVQRELEARAARPMRAAPPNVERINMKPSWARRRYMKVDPDNPLVRITLEADWKEKLRLHAEGRRGNTAPKQAPGCDAWCRGPRDVILGLADAAANLE